MSGFLQASLWNWMKHVRFFKYHLFFRLLGTGPSKGRSDCSHTAQTVSKSVLCSEWCRASHHLWIKVTRLSTKICSKGTSSSRLTPVAKLPVFHTWMSGKQRIQGHWANFFFLFWLYCRKGFAGWEREGSPSGSAGLSRFSTALSTCPQFALFFASFSWGRPSSLKGRLSRKLRASSLNGNCSANLIITFAVKCKLVTMQWD